MAGNDFRQVFGRGQELFARLNPVQKIAVGAAVSTIVIGALVVSRSGGSTDMAPLFTDLDAADASAIVDELSSRSVAYDLTDAGRTILVPTDDLYEMRLALSASGLPASSDGYALLDEQGITTSEFRQRIDYQRALEGELASTLRAMDGIAAATVHLALPDDSLFVDEAANPTASVLLVARGTTGITDDQVDAVVHLVSSSIKDLSPEDVTVIGSDGQVLSAPGRAVGGTGGGTARAKAERAYETEVGTSLTAMLARVTGPGKVAVTVSADLDLSERQSTSENYTTTPDDAGAVPVISEQTSSEVYATDGSTAATGVLGADGAEVATDAAAAADLQAGDYQKLDADRRYALDRTVEQVTEAPGAIERLTVAVLIDEASVTDAQTADLEAMVAAAAGIDEERGDTVVVTRMPFDGSAVETATAAAEAEAAAAAKADKMALYRMVAIVVLAIVALLLAFFSARRARRVTLTPIEIGEISAGGRRPDPPHEGGAAAELPGITRVLPAAEPAEPLVAPGALRELTEIADRRPEDVASVLRTWLAESDDRSGRR